MHSWTTREIIVETETEARILADWASTKIDHEVKKVYCIYCKKPLEWQMADTGNLVEDLIVHPVHNCPKLPDTALPEVETPAKVSVPAPVLEQTPEQAPKAPWYRRLLHL